MNTKRMKTLQKCIENIYNRSDLMLVCMKNFDLERLQKDTKDLMEDLALLEISLKMVEDETARIKVSDLLSEEEK